MLHIRDTYQKQKGISLIELVVSVGISSFILLTTFLFYNFGIKAYRDELDKLYVHQNARQALYVISNNIRNAKTARIVTRRKIEIINQRGEKLYFSLENGSLYRIKNFTKNPVASVDKLSFTKPQNRE